jgi:hypothetical protein
VARKSGVYPYYCTNFCSALHQEMQGYLEVVPQGRALTMYDGGRGEMLFARRPAAPAPAPAAGGDAHAAHATGDVSLR